MKPRLGRLALLAGAGALAFCAWTLAFPNPEHVVRKRLSELARLASFSPNDAPLARLASAQNLADDFTPDAQVTVDVPGRSPQTYNGRQEIQEAALGVRAILTALTLRFVDVTVTVAADRQAALAHCTAAANLPGEKIPEVQELDVTFIKTGRDWLVSRIETIKTLR